MPYLIDGNNVMAQAGGGWHRNLPAARKRLILDLVRFVAVRKVKVKVVFDGVPDTEFPDNRMFKGVHILYAKRSSDADSRIKELILRVSYVRDLILVSSDRDLGLFAHRRGADVMPSHKFRALLEETNAQAEADKSILENRVNVEEWLEFFRKK